MATLGELIERRKTELGLTYRQLGQRAKDAGATTEPNFFHLVKQGRRLREYPKIKTIHALAAALEVTPEEVAEAASESLGLGTKVDPTVPPKERWIPATTGSPASNLDDPAFWNWLAGNIPVDAYRTLREMFVQASGEATTTTPTARKGGDVTPSG